MDAHFVAGKELSRELAAIVEPVLRQLAPRTPLALAFIGAGSDVLGYDTARSMDHDWGPRLTIVVAEDGRAGIARRINENIDLLLPPVVSGFPTRFSRHADDTLFPDPGGTVHRLNVTSVPQIVQASLLVDAAESITDSVWLSTPMQALLELTAGEVFCDDDGDITRLRQALAFYPDHVWRYQLSSLWMRIGQIQPFIGRTGEAGDQAGSVVITASIARELMRIVLLQSREYAPYAKWLGTACVHTSVGQGIHSYLSRALAATDWQAREQELNAAGVLVIDHLNTLGLVDAIPARSSQFHTRPFHVLPAEEIARALHNSLAGTPLANLTPFAGGIDVVTDSTDALKSVPFRTAIRAMFTECLNTRA
jgi:hypothetical protein